VDVAGKIGAHVCEGAIEPLHNEHKCRAVHHDLAQPHHVGMRRTLQRLEFAPHANRQPIIYISKKDLLVPPASLSVGQVRGTAPRVLDPGAGLIGSCLLQCDGFATARVLC
jgi:hypothetical protein